MMKRLEKWYPVVAMISIDLVFAISNVLLKQIVSDGMDHLVFITYRQSISAIFLSPLAFFLERQSRPKLTLSLLCQLFLSAIIGASLTQYLFLLGIEYTSATFSCAFLNMVPVITFLMALPFGMETVNIRKNSGRAKVVGTLVCLGGVVLLTVYKGRPLFRFSSTTDVHQSMGMKVMMNTDSGVIDDRRRESMRWGIGCAALFAGTFCWSSWFLLQSNIGKRYPCQYSSTAIMTCFSALQSAVLSLSLDHSQLSVWILIKKTDIFIILYAGMIGTGLSFVGMSWCVKKRGPVFTAAFSPFVQIMAAFFDVPVLHEQLHLGSLVGSIVVIAGLYILLWGKDKEMQRLETVPVQEGAQEMNEHSEQANFQLAVK